MPNVNVALHFLGLYFLHSCWYKYFTLLQNAFSRIRTGCPKKSLLLSLELNILRLSSNFLVYFVNDPFIYIKLILQIGVFLVFAQYIKTFYVAFPSFVNLLPLFSAHA